MPACGDKRAMAAKDDISRVLRAIKKVFGKWDERMGRTLALHGRVLAGLQTAFKDHEKRLKTLEDAR